MPSGQLLGHLQSLLGQSRPAAEESSWTDLIQSWEATGLPVTAEQEDFELDLPVGIPLPTLLDYYNPPAEPARLDDHANHVLTARAGAGPGAGEPGDYEEDQLMHGPDGEARDLTSRLKK
jgi:hypothetical protein